MNVLFETGTICATAAVWDCFPNAKFLLNLVERHQSGDWGELPDEERESSTQAVVQGEIIKSQYTTESGDVIWVMTESDRSITVILFPYEY